MPKPYVFLPDNGGFPCLGVYESTKTGNDYYLLADNRYFLKDDSLGDIAHIFLDDKELHGILAEHLKKAIPEQPKVLCPYCGRTNPLSFSDYDEVF